MSFSLAKLWKKHLESIFYESQIKLYFMQATLHCVYHLVCTLYYFQIILNINKFSNLRNGNNVIILKPTCTYTSVTTEYSDCRLVTKALLSTEPDILTLDCIYYSKSNTIPVCQVTSGKYTCLNAN